jgi:hypothetical protein
LGNLLLGKVEADAYVLLRTTYFLVKIGALTDLVQSMPIPVMGRVADQSNTTTPGCPTLQIL